MSNQQNTTNPGTGTTLGAGQPTTGRGNTEWTVLMTAAMKRIETTKKRIREIVEDAPEGAGQFILSTLGSIAMSVFVIVLLVRLVIWAATIDPLEALKPMLPAGKVAAEPFMHWFTTHLTGLPISAETGVWIWGITGLIVWFVASCHHLAAQALWVGYGAATAAIVWTGTPVASHRPVTTGLAVIAWTILSLFVLTRRPVPYRFRPAAS